MSAEEVESVRRVYETFNDRREDVVAECLDPDVEVIPAAQFVGGPARGHDEVRRMIDTFTEAFEQIRWDPVRIVESSEPGDVVALVDIYTRGRGSGAEVTVRVAHITSLRDGKVTRLHVFPKAEDGWKAAGLDPAAYLT